MKDKNGKPLKKGDWVLYDPSGYSNNFSRAGQIAKIESLCTALLYNDPSPWSDVALIYYKNDPDPWHREGIYLEKISNKEAMIYLLEN